MLLFCLYLGIAGWGLPIFAIIVREKIQNFSWFLWGSYTCCGLSAVLALYDVKSFIDKEDWSGVMDVYPTLNLAIAVMVFVTIALNTAALLVYNRKQKRLIAPVPYGHWEN